MPTRVVKLLKEHWILSCAMLAALLVYFNLLFFGAISWDDPEMIFKNKDVKNFDLSAIFSNHYVGNYIPITMLFHALIYFLFQTWAGGHHFVSILFHLANCILVYQITIKVFKSKYASQVACLVFLLHPLQIEAVAWISEFKTLLSASFALLSLLYYLQFIENKKTSALVLSLLLFLLGSLSKPSVLLMPLLLIVFDWFQNKTISISTLIKLSPFLLISLIMAYITIQTQTADQFINHAHEFSYVIRFGMAGLAFFNYLILFFLPINLSVIYSYPTVDNQHLIIGYSLLVVFFLLLIYFIQSKKYNYVLALLFFIVNLILMVQIIPFGEALFADRYMYLSIIGLAWILAFALEKFKLQNNSLLLVLILVNSFFGYSRTMTWKSSLSLYEDIIKKYPNQFVALNSAGVECMLLNDYEKSMTYFKRAIAAAPNNYKGYYNLGLLFLKNNQAKQAIESFNQTIHLYEYHKAYAARASAYYMLNDLPKAINDANKVLTLDFKNSKAHFILGNCYNDLNQLEDAIKEYNIAIQIHGDESDYYFKRGIALGKQQNFRDCYKDLVVCIELNPNNFEAHYWKGVSLVNLKQNPCEAFKIAAQNNFEPAVNAYNKYCR